MDDMLKSDVGRTLLGKRKFHVEGLSERIELHIFEPRREDGAWICEYQMNVPGFDRHIFVPITGADKLESVTAVIRRIRSDLKLIAERLGREVTFLGEPRLDLI